jgi:signal transduction histidine kinase
VIGGELLRDAFENIMLNGCIHNKSEKLRLWINVSKVSEVLKVFKAREEPEKLVKIEFKDNGTGIRGEMKEAIFEREPKHGSDGSRVSLGLWLVKNIIEEYNGRVRVEDRVSGDHTQGSNFIVYLREA